ncbi:MAG TPA: T9SS type A sorting domain-containing protein [Ignavibacteriaceae bacterium]
MKTFYTFLSILFFTATIHSTTIRVPQDYQEIQSAINAAQDGDTILVARGSYTENINFRGKGIVLTSNFLFSNDLEDIDSTIIDGSEPVDPDTASCVLMYKSNNSFSDDSSAALIGFTLTGGKGTAWNDEHNLGSFYREGGGILIQYWAPRIRFNKIIDNEAYDKIGLTSAGGGAIRCGDGNPLIENNLILHNRGRYGAGVVFNYSGGVIRNNVIADNFGGEDYAGGGLWILGNRFDNKIKVIENNTIVNNSSVLAGGGIFLWGGSVNYVRNNIVWGNTAPASPQIRVTASSAQIIYNDVEGGYTGEGNINLNPDFILPVFYLSNTSPCIDAGKDSVIFNDREDPLSPGNALYPSKGTLRNDMGVFGGPNCSDLPLIITSVEDETQGNIPDEFKLFQNYPNPFNPSTNITFRIAEFGFVSLKVYDILGNEVATIVDEYKPAGNYAVEFTAEGLTSGIYFYKLIVGDFAETKKMILIK